MLPYPSFVAEANNNRIRKEPAYVKDSKEATAIKAAHLVFRRQPNDFCTSCLCGCTAFDCSQVGLLNHSLQTLKRLDHDSRQTRFWRTNFSVVPGGRLDAALLRSVKYPAILLFRGNQFCALPEERF